MFSCQGLDLLCQLIAGSLLETEYQTASYSIPEWILRLAWLWDSDMQKKMWEKFTGTRLNFWTWQDFLLILKIMHKEVYVTWSYLRNLLTCHRRSFKCCFILVKKMQLSTFSRQYYLFIMSYNPVHKI